MPKRKEAEKEVPKLKCISTLKSGSTQYLTSHKNLSDYKLRCGDYVAVKDEGRGWVIGYNENAYKIGFHMESGKEIDVQVFSSAIPAVKARLKKLVTVLHREDGSPMPSTKVEVAESYNNLRLLEPEKTYGSDIVLILPNSAKFQSIPDQFYIGKRYELKLHKTILACCSDFFFGNFYGNFESPQSMKMKVLDDVKSDTRDEIRYFWSFIRFLYGERSNMLTMTELIYMYYYAIFAQVSNIKHITFEIELKTPLNYELADISPLFAFAELLGWESYIGKLLFQLLSNNWKRWNMKEAEIRDFTNMLKAFPKFMDVAIFKFFELLQK